MPYGFSSIVVPFDRFLVCPRCHSELPILRVVNTPVFKFLWTDFRFSACCQCGHDGEWGRKDVPKEGHTGIIRRYDPATIEKLRDDFDDEDVYLWRIPQELQDKIRAGQVASISRLEWDIIQCVALGKRLRFDSGILREERAVRGDEENR